MIRNIKFAKWLANIFQRPNVYRIICDKGLEVPIEIKFSRHVIPLERIETVNHFVTQLIQVLKKPSFHPSLYSTKWFQVMLEFENEWLFWSGFCRWITRTWMIKVTSLNQVERFLRKWFNLIGRLFLRFSRLLQPCLYDTVSTITCYSCTALTEISEKVWCLQILHQYLKVLKVKIQHIYMNINEIRFTAN